ncbi:MAG: AcrB/AcrD/AcrF family protein [Methylococcaceae bacterium]|nr:AcrB/AcrD/AcrF family protein [Methylococcaceae bacterium]
MYRKLLTNTVLVNLTFLLVVIAGWLSYVSMPREQDPDVNFNWVVINTVWPGATAEDVENQITNPLEDEIENIPDVNRVSSSSRVAFSFITVRFADMEPSLFRQRVEELRRTIQSAVDNLPPDSKQPVITELSSSNTYPTAVVTVSGIENDEILRKASRNTAKDIARIKGVDRADTWGTEDPELQIHFDPAKLVGLGVSPTVLASTVNAYFRDLTAGSIQLGEQQWNVRLTGTHNDPSYLANLPILTIDGELPLRSVATVVRGQEKASQLVSYEGRPATMVSVFKRGNANSLNLLEDLQAYVQERNIALKPLGIQLDIVDDQTVATRTAISMMEKNAVIGLILVMIVTGLFLGWRIAIFTGLGLIFSLMGSFWILSAMGETLNIMVLLGVVIVLGMLVDDAVVVVESMYVNLKRGMNTVDAALSTTNEMWVPVMVSSLTTIAAFLPLILLPGILGQFMRIVPIVVSVALVVSLIEAFWLLPSHIISSNANPAKNTFIQRMRNKVTRWIRHRYINILVPVMRYPRTTIASGALISVLAVFAVTTNIVRVDFFANDPIRLFYLNVYMPAGTSLSSTDDTLKKLDLRIRNTIAAKELRSISTTAGVLLTETEPLFGDSMGQLMFSLPARTEYLLSVDSLIEEVRLAVSDVPGPEHLSFLRRNTGPPSESPISVKVRGDNITELRAATAALEEIMARLPGIQDLHNDDAKSGMQLTLKLNPDTITRAQLNPADIAEILRLYVDGNIVANMRFEGEKWNVRVQAKPSSLQDIKSFLNHPVGLADGSEIALGQLLTYSSSYAEGTIHHRNFRRTITLESDLDTMVTDSITANGQIAEKWREIADNYPDVTLDFSGEMDDIQESLAGMAVLFLFGIGLIYMILGTQFKSYTQPLLILATVPMAFTGVIIGLIVSNNPLSLYTLYGVIALAGIVANDAIVLISTANRNLAKGMKLAHAIVLASQRRVMPILITTITTMAGLFSLASGWGGKSLMWGPLATAIVWGLGFATILTLLIIPPLYGFIMRNKTGKKAALSPPPTLPDSRSSLLSSLKSLFKGRQIDSEGLNEIAENATLKILYEMAAKEFEHGEVEVAIRHFQALAKQLPDNFTANLMAAQSLMLFMQKIGWDIGYIDRAKRYFSRANQLHPEDERVIHLARLIEELENDSEIDWEKLAK